MQWRYLERLDQHKDIQNIETFLRSRKDNCPNFKNSSSCRHKVYDVVQYCGGAQSRPEQDQTRPARQTGRATMWSRSSTTLALKTPYYCSTTSVDKEYQTGNFKRPHITPAPPWYTHTVPHKHKISLIIILLQYFTLNTDSAN